MSAPTILILSHRGKSFVLELLEAARKLGLQGAVLSSMPEDATGQRIERIREKATLVRVTSQPSLTDADTIAAIEELKDSGVNLVACISVWDGYRAQMATGNQRLGARDLSSEALARVLDKHLFRSTLAAVGLTRVQSTIVSPQNLEGLKSGEPRFIKPRRGVASFSAFRLTSDLTWADLENMRAQMAQDTDYAEIFRDRVDFIAEDYIEGQEFCFEMVCEDGNAHCLAVHQKVALEEQGRTVLESACVSPPVGVPEASVEAGVSLVKRTLSSLGATSGCFHVEARRSEASGAWELIEVNPRTGGAYIYHSVRATTGGACMLEMWIRSLIPNHAKDTSNPQMLEARRRGGSTPATFFRVFFGEPGRVVAKIGFSDAPGTLRKPDLSQLSVEAGKALPASDREVFLGQAFWQLPKEELSVGLRTFIRESERALEVEYQ